MINKNNFIIKTLLLIITATLLLTSCQTGSNIEQSSTSSESVQSSSSPEEEVILFGKPLNEIDWSPAISQSFETMFETPNRAVSGYELNSHETAMFLRDIIGNHHTAFFNVSYPSVIQLNDTNWIKGWVNYALYRIRDGFRGKNWADYPYHGEPFPDGFVPQFSIPVEEIADCLSAYYDYPGDMLEKIRLVQYYRPETDTIDEAQFGWGGGHAGYAGFISIDSVVAASSNTLQIRYSDWDYGFFSDLNSDQSYEAFLEQGQKDFTMEITVRITSDEDAKWQIVSCSTIE